MPTRTVGTADVHGKYVLNTTWDRSPRDVHGQLQLRQNALSRRSAAFTSGNAAWWASTGTLTWQWHYGVPLDTAKAKAGKAYNGAYKKFREFAWDSAQAAVAVDLAERSKTYQMISARLDQLARFARAVKAKRFADAARALRSPNSQLGKPGTKKPKPSKFNTFGENYMEYRYGWGPLMGSIGDLCEVLSRQRTSPEFVRGIGYDHIVHLDNKEAANVSNVKLHLDTECFLTLKGRVAVNNPDLFRLNQYGLANPLVVGLELIPFSFVLEWFVKVGDYLSSLTDWVGFSFNDLAYTCRFEGKTTYEAWYQNKWQITAVAHGNYKFRVLVASPPMPELQFGSGFKVQQDRWTAEKRALDSVFLIANFLPQALTGKR